MPQSYTPEFKKKIVRLHEEEGRTYKSITAEYGVAKSSISKWCTELRRKCLTSPQAKEEYDSMKELMKLKRENEELRKEVAFIKASMATGVCVYTWNRRGTVIVCQPFINT